LWTWQDGAPKPLFHLAQRYLLRLDTLKDTVFYRDGALHVAQGD